MMTRREQIKNAYKLTGGHASFYDGILSRKLRHSPGQSMTPVSRHNHAVFRNSISASAYCTAGIRTAGSPLDAW